MSSKKINILDYPQPAIDFSPRIPKLKKEKNKSKINVRYCLIAPFAYVHIHWDPKEYEVLYDIEEPVLDKDEMVYMEQLISGMKNMINFDEVIHRTRDALFEYIDKRFKMFAIELGMNISYESYRKINRDRRSVSFIL